MLGESVFKGAMPIMQISNVGSYLLCSTKEQDFRFYDVYTSDDHWQQLSLSGERFGYEGPMHMHKVFRTMLQNAFGPMQEYCYYYCYNFCY